MHQINNKLTGNHIGRVIHHQLTEFKGHGSQTFISNNTMKTANILVIIAAE